MIYVGLDDTDMPDTPGTNQLARVLIQHVADRYRCRHLLRHQLLFDPRVPYTSKNGSASLLLEPLKSSNESLEPLIASLRARMLEWYVSGSDPGLCVTKTVPEEIVAFAQRCQRELMTRGEAEELAARQGVYLEGLGGTRGGMIGALAAVGLASTGNDGRVVVNGAWPDDLSGRQPVALLEDRGVDVRCAKTGRVITQGGVDVGKHLRPNLREGRIVLFVESAEWGDDEWRAVRVP